MQVVGGPNKRTDYHVNPTEEYFFQMEGDMVLRTVQEGEFKDICINEGVPFRLSC